MLEFNEYQTQIDEEYLNSLPSEIKEQFYDAITNIPFIKRIVSKDRPKACDLPRDSEGKIIIDITQPHTIEDTDYFRPTALHFQKYGCLTKLKPNANPNSEFGKWFREEVRRCWEGYIRPSDGEWITGDMYFFLNYCPIQLIKKNSNGDTIRTIDFPSFFDGNYYRFHYLNQCRKEGKHAMELAKRGAGKAHPYDELVWTPEGLKLWKDIKVGDFLFGDDGYLTKVIDIPFDDIAPIYEVELANGSKVKCSEGHLWKVFSHIKGEIIVSTKELLSIYKRPRKVSSHNPSGYELDCTIPVSKGVDFEYKPTKVDPYTFGLMLGDGCFRIPSMVNKTYFTSSDEDFEIYKNFIPYNWVKYNNTKFGYNLNIPNFGDILKEYGLWFLKSENKFIPKEYMYNSRAVRLNVLKGILDADGTVDKGRIELVLSSKRLIEDVKWICASLGINTTESRTKHTWYYNSKREKVKCLDAYRLSIFSEIPLFNLPRKLALWENRPKTNYAKSKYKGSKIVNIKYIGNKKAKCVTVDNESHCYLINDFVVTHNSYSAASLLAKRFILGEGKDVQKKVQCVATASERKYIQGANQLLDMFQYYIDFCANNTEFPGQRLTSSLQNMQWTMGYLDVDSGTRRGTQNSVIGITSKDDESKLRGSRGVLYLLEEAGCHLKGTECYKADKTITKVEDVKIGDSLLGPDMLPRKVLEVFHGSRNMYKITLSNGDTQIVTDNHPVYVKVRTWGKKAKEEFKTFTCEELLKKNYKKGYYIVKQPIVYNYKEPLIDPYMLGLWLGDGDSSRVSFAVSEIEIQEYFKSFKDKCYLKECTNTDKCYVAHFPSNSNKELYDKFKEYNLFNNKHIPEDYKYNSTEVLVNLVAGIIDSDGYYDQRRHIYEVVQHHSRKHIIYDLKDICENLGMKCTICTKIGSKKSLNPGELYYRLFIRSNINIPVKVNKKKFTDRSNYRNKINWNEYSFNIEPYGEGEYYGFLIDKDNLFLLKDKTIVHNSFPRLLNLYQVLRPSVEDGSRVFGLIYGYGTSGDSESDFSSMQELMYNPDGYNIKGVPNVYDKEGQGRKKFTYFYPGYLNRADCYDKDGNSDVIKALLEILQDRYKVKYNSTDINAITKRIAEIPLTPQEAIQRSRGNIFPITELTQRLNEIDNNPNFFDDVYIGTLVMNSSGKVEFSISTADKPIRDFPTKDNKLTGALEIYEMPQEIQGKIPLERYIVSLDNYENDESNTMSLGSLFVLDLWTDRIVAEFTGRPTFVDDLNELARKVCLFYNAKLLYENNKKNTFAYFSRMSSLHLLADTPEYLKNKQLIKFTGYGNTSKGVNATAPIKNFGFMLIRDWLLKPVTVTKKEGDEVVEYTVPNLHFLKNRALIKELMLYNPAINVDRIMSLVQLMLYREEKMILYQGDPSSSNKTDDSNYLGNDPFFKQNYNHNYTQ